MAGRAAPRPLTHQARDYVDTAARGKADEDAHRLGRIGLRPSDARHGRQRGSARCQLQKLSSVGKLHSITSSARASKVGGTCRPSAFAVLRLITNLIGAWTESARQIGLPVIGVS